MKKLVCGSFGHIYYATILKDGLMSSTGRVELTDSAITAVVDHILSMSEYKKNNGFSGYEFKKNDGNKITLCVFDNDSYKLTKKQQAEINGVEIKDEDKDAKFLTHIIQEICAYANQEGIEQNETMRTVANGILSLLEIATFNENKGEEQNG